MIVAAVKDDLTLIENAALAPARRTVSRLRAEVLQAYQSGNRKFSAQFIIKELQPILRKAASVSHAAGQKRSVLAARKHVKQIELSFDLLDDVKKLLKKTVKVDFNKVEKAYDAAAFKALTNFSAPIEKRVRENIVSLIGRGALLKDAIDELDQTLNRLGVGPVEEYKLETLFRTQLQTSYNAGRWQANQDPDIQEILWGYKYVTVGDDRVREEHAELDGTTLPKDDPFWLEYWPPNGWNCRCQVIEVFEEREIVQPGLLADGEMPQPDEGFAFNPGVVLADATTKAEFQLAQQDMFSIMLAAWDESSHPRVPAGSDAGGEFLGTNSGSKSKPAFTKEVLAKVRAKIKAKQKAAAETKQVETKQVETKQVETKQVETKQVETKIHARKLDTDKDIEEFSSSSLQSKLNDAEKNSLDVYTSEQAYAINSTLRQGRESGPNVKEHIKNLDSTIAKNQTTESVVVYRGVPRSTKLGDLKEGVVFQDKAFVSTSLSSKVADDVFSDGIMMEISVPKGTNAVSVDAVFNKGLKGYSERELLLGRGNKFKITGRRIVGKQTHLLCEVIK